jgi:hypothetical protein
MESRAKQSRMKKKGVIQLVKLIIAEKSSLTMPLYQRILYSNQLMIVVLKNNIK